MAKITFYPLSNADSALIDTDSNRKILIDYAHTKESENEDDLRIDLQTELLENLEDAERDYFDVVAFTHADKDHTQKASDFFEFDHADKYKGGDRVKINKLWIPAGFLTETGLTDDARIIQAEAKYRLINNYGVRIFARPDSLTKFLENNGLTLAERKHLITDAGNIVPGITKASDGMELFVHSPFSFLSDGKTEDRNQGSLVLHATFEVSNQETKVMFGADSTHEAWVDIVNITSNKGRNERLEWDVFKISHHCSYLALSDEKKRDKTIPKPEIAFLFEQGHSKGIIVSSSNVIPTTDSDQPPHKQAAAYYKERASLMSGKFEVTMEHPKISAPEPIVINIDKFGASLKMVIPAAVSSIASRPAPRAGRGDIC